MSIFQKVVVKKTMYKCRDLKRIRKERGLSTRELSAQSGVSHTIIYMLENQIRPVSEDIKEKLALVLDR